MWKKFANSTQPIGMKTKTYLNPSWYGEKSIFLSSRGAQLVITQYNSGQGLLVVRDTCT